jgi:hypothetical protein
MRAKNSAPRAVRQGAARLAGGGEQSANAFVIRASDTRYGPQKRWGPREFAQAAIASLFRTSIPSHLPGISRLTRQVNELLQKDCGYRSVYGVKKVDRRTVERALDTLQRGNP